MLSILPLMTLSLMGCSDKVTALGDLDARYKPIMVRLGQAQRDSARNVRNSNFRNELALAKRAQSNFFQDIEVQRLIEAGLSGSEGSIERSKAEAYHRQMVTLQAWTEEDRLSEARILARLEEKNSERKNPSQVFTLSKAGEEDIEIPLAGSWSKLIQKTRDFSVEDREAYVAQYVDLQMSVIGEELRELVELRNDVARRAGFDNYWHLSLEKQGLTQADVDELVLELETIIESHHLHIRDRRENVAQQTGLPNTYAHSFLIDQYAIDYGPEDDGDNWFDGDLAEERIRLAFQDMGFPVSNWEVHTGPSRHVRVGAFSFPIHPPERIAIVMSVDAHQRLSTWPYEALAHEGGLATWWQGLDTNQADSPVLWQPTAPWFEGYGGFFERLLYEPSFLARYVPEVPEEVRNSLQQQRARDTAHRITNQLIQLEVEQALYEAPGDLSAVATQGAQRRHALTHRATYPTTSGGMVYEPSLLSSILWNYPGYSANFLFAYLSEAWIFAAVVDQVGNPVANNRVSNFLNRNLVQANPSLSIQARLESIYPTERTQPLRDYLNSAPPLPSVPADLPQLSEPPPTPEPTPASLPAAPTVTQEELVVESTSETTD